MTKNKNIHTVYNNKEKQWENKEANNKNPFAIASTKKEAQNQGREQAIKNNSENIIHNKDGQISDKNSYGNDPKNIKG